MQIQLIIIIANSQLISLTKLVNVVVCTAGNWGTDTGGGAGTFSVAIFECEFILLRKLELLCEFRAMKGFLSSKQKNFKIESEIWCASNKIQGLSATFDLQPPNQWLI